MSFRYSVKGVLRQKGTGSPIGGLVVRAFDQDPVFDDALGTAVTDGAGWFEIHFTELAFRDGLEQRPDVYLRIYDPEGSELLLETRDAVRHNARAEETFELDVAWPRVV